MIYITGDTHRDFRRVYEFAKRRETTKNDLLIILGDAGINITLDERDRELKAELQNTLPLSLFLVKGNHEARPESIASYREVDWMGAKAYAEAEFPNLIFAKDGEIYHFAGQETLVIGGAYSVDKFLRLSRGYFWFEDEQPTDEIKYQVEQTLARRNWQVDVVLTHTVPRSCLPTWNFSPNSPYKNIDYTTEDWLEKIYQRLNFNKWYAGHLHVNSYEGQAKKVRLMFGDIDIFGAWAGDRILSLEGETGEAAGTEADL